MRILNTAFRLAAVAAVAFVLASPASTWAQNVPPPTPAPPSKLAPPSITLAEARAIIDGAIAYARQRNLVMAVMVVDAAGNPVSSDRMDGVSANNVVYAEGKAFASALQRQTTQTLSDLAKDRPDRYFGIMSMYPGKMYLVGGGVPIIANGVLVGAVGVAGLPQYEDEAAGRAGIAAWERSRAGAR
jgi:glc operon protein GlcG